MYGFDERTFLTTFIFFLLDAINCQYVPPEATVLPLRPIGIKISIPDEEGISLVAYHVKFNKEFYGLEAGTIARDIIKPKNGKWTYEDRSTKLKDGDVIYYWVHVVFEGLGYNLLEQQHIVTEFYDYNGVPIGGSTGAGFSGNATCSRTVTKVFDGDGQTRNICGGDLIFEDLFNNDNQLNQSMWNIVEKFPGAPDYEFVVYRNDKRNVNVVNGNLKMTPVLLDSTCGSNFAENGSLTLHKCTGQPGSRECQRQAHGFQILPPIISGQINTKNIFSFQYGRIVMRARMPRGDWIYPMLRLEPFDKQGILTGNDATFCFQLRIASTLGNTELRSFNEEDLSGHVLRGGFLSHTMLHTTDVTTLKTNDSTRSKTSDKLWSEDFHLFEMEWKPEALISKVDGEIYGEINLDSPLQTPFYITLGVAVGGYTEFPDNSKSSGYMKPWSNFKSKALLNFYRQQSTWFNTWTKGSATATSLKVDFIKIWAL